MYSSSLLNLSRRLLATKNIMQPTTSVPRIAATATPILRMVSFDKLNPDSDEEDEEVEEEVEEVLENVEVGVE